MAAIRIQLSILFLANFRWQSMRNCRPRSRCCCSGLTRSIKPSICWRSNSSSRSGSATANRLKVSKSGNSICPPAASRCMVILKQQRSAHNSTNRIRSYIRRLPAWFNPYSPLSNPIAPKNDGSGKLPPAYSLWINRLFLNISP